MRPFPSSLPLLLLAGTLAAQPTPSSATVHGVAFDSLRGRPLGGAFVTLDGERNTAADDAGRFTFDAVTPGTHTLAVQHAALDSAGLTGIASRIAVTDGRDDVRIATPSFATFWRSVCGADHRAPKDSGLVYGTVADARTGTRLAGASVDVTWLQLAAVDRQHRLEVTQVPWRGVTRTSGDGAYVLCGVPLGVSLRIRALTDTSSSGVLDLLADDLRVRRRDFLVGPTTVTTVADTTSADSTARRPSPAAVVGTIVGTVITTTGAPIPDAHVTVDGLPELRSDSAGRFVARNVPVGTRQVEVLALGMMPAVTMVDVTARDTATVAAQLRRVTTLDVVKVTASRRARQLVAELEERRRIGFGYVRDSTAFVGHGTLASVFDEFPGARMEPERGTSTSRFVVTMRAVRAGDRCVATVWVDGFRADYDYLVFLRPEDIAVAEVYPDPFNVPTRYTSKIVSCGVIAVWTKNAFR